MRGGINRSASKGVNKDGAYSWDGHNLDVGVKEGAELETTKRDKKNYKESEEEEEDEEDGVVNLLIPTM